MVFGSQIGIELQQFTAPIDLGEQIKIKSTQKWYRFMHINREEIHIK